LTSYKLRNTLAVLEEHSGVGQSAKGRFAMTTKATMSLALTVLLAIPSLAAAQQDGPLRATAERLARETELQQGTAGDLGTRRSAGRVAIGLGMVGAGVAMLLIDPDQPTQPNEVPENVLVNEAAAFLTSSTFARLVADRGTTYFCYPNFERSCEFTLDAYVKGVVDGGIVGAAGALTVAAQGDRMVYAGPIQEFEERNNGLKYGGAALAIGGALVAGFWSDVPVMRQLRVAATPRGLRLSTSVGF
jgi:hypothetical protein